MNTSVAVHAHEYGLTAYVIKHRSETLTRRVAVAVTRMNFEEDKGEHVDIIPIYGTVYCGPDDELKRVAVAVTRMNFEEDKGEHVDIIPIYGTVYCGPDDELKEEKDA